MYLNVTTPSLDGLACGWHARRDEAVTEDALTV